MEKFTLENISLKDINEALNIYNSNAVFLANHLGSSFVSQKFILDEMKEMKKAGFNSKLIKTIKGELIGICDYKIGDEVYLSLLIIDGHLKGKGFGKSIYNHLERIFKSKNANRIRIDVVYDYEENVVGFWEKQGFTRFENIELEWNKHKSSALKMYKDI